MARADAEEEGARRFRNSRIGSASRAFLPGKWTRSSTAI